MFITFEGMEGAGKSTVMDRAAAWLAGLGREVARTREPGGSPLGRELRSILLDPRNSGIVPRAELFLYLADRAQHAAAVVRPALRRGAVVLSDRYADSTVVYQGYGRGLDIEELHMLNGLAVDGVWPDVTVLLDLDPVVGLGRANARNERDGTAAAEGRFEAESLAFHARVREGFLDWAARNGDRFAVIDAGRDPETVFADVKAAIEAAMARNGAG